jgi:hypothetical protein
MNKKIIDEILELKLIVPQTKEIKKRIQELQQELDKPNKKEL